MTRFIVWRNTQFLRTQKIVIFYIFLYTIMSFLETFPLLKPYAGYNCLIVSSVSSAGIYIVEKCFHCPISQFRKIRHIFNAWF